MPRLFIFGLGYSARVLADRLRAEGWQIAGTTRDDDKAYKLHAAGIDAHLFDRGRPLIDPQKALAGTTHLLSSVPPDDWGDAVLDHHQEDLARLSDLTWAGYLSTTGVYGDHDGAFVDEDSALKPQALRSRRRAAAERAWWDFHRLSAKSTQVFRLAGIYGPGRNALVERLSGRARMIEKPGHFFSRIHVDDIAQVLRASIQRPQAHRIYNVADDLPAPQAEVMAYACELLHLPPPPKISFDEAKATMSEIALSFWADNKRVKNQRIKEELGVRLAYPTYREGLQAQLSSLRG